MRLEAVDQVVDLVLADAQLTGQLLGQGGLGRAALKLAAYTLLDVFCLQVDLLLFWLGRRDHQGDLSLDGLAAGKLCGQLVCG